MSKKSDINFLNTHNLLGMYYQNAKNSIEDPIFTGFTFDIDKPHSPLFYSVCEKEYAESLRSPDGTDTKLSEAIEKKLNYVQKVQIASTPSTYEINTIEAKNPFGSNNRRKPGYGLQEWHYIDNVLYGATDYIYMVDKVRDGIYERDRAGVTDIGNGTPNDTKLQEEYLNRLNNISNEVKDKINETLRTEIFFDINKTNLKDSERIKLDNFVKYLEDYPSASIQLDGYASTIGNDEQHNMDLSKNRIITVKNYLTTDKQIEPSRISIETAHGQHDGPYTDPAEKEKNQLTVCQIAGISDQDAVKIEIDKKNDEISNNSDSLKEYNDIITKLWGGDGCDSENNKYSMSNPAPGSKMDEYLQATNENSEYRQLEKEVHGMKDIISQDTANVGVLISDYANDMSSAFINYIKPKTSEEQTTAKEKINGLWKSYLNVTGFTQEQLFINYVEPETVEVNKDADISENTNSQSNSEEKVSPTKDSKDVFEKWKTCEYISADRKNLQTSEYLKITFYLNINMNDEIQKVKDDIKDTSVSNNPDINEIIQKYICVTKTRNKPVQKSDDFEKVRQTKQTRLEELSEEIYGKNGTAENPTGGKALELNNLLKDYNANPITQAKNEVALLQDIQANAQTVRNINEYQSKKNTYEQLELPSTDVTKDDGTPVIKYEVPQTVYDMIGFVQGMEKLTYEYPYVFQSITGLDEAYKKYFEIKDPHMGSGDDKISIECLEFLDLRVSAMFNKYFNAVYDRQYRRERVPINLRRFNCSVFVHDIRNFKNSINNSNVEKSGDLSMIAKIALNYMSAIEFKFFDCEIVPTETGSIFDSVANNSAGDMRKTKFTFTYGNCMINFLPFEDLRRYVLDREISGIQPGEMSNYQELGDLGDDAGWGNKNSATMGPDGNFRRWFDKSVLGNVNNNDYRDYIRHDTSVAVDDHFKTTIVNTFALGSVAQKNKELTALDDALRRIVVGISASTGIPTTGVADALNIGFINPILNEVDKSVPIVKRIGNVTNSTILDAHTTDYIGTIEGLEEEPQKNVSDLGNVNK